MVGRSGAAPRPSRPDGRSREAPRRGGRGLGARMERSRRQERGEELAAAVEAGEQDADGAVGHVTDGSAALVRPASGRAGSRRPAASGGHGIIALPERSSVGCVADFTTRAGWVKSSSCARTDSESTLPEERARTFGAVLTSEPTQSTRRPAPRRIRASRSTARPTAAPPPTHATPRCAPRSMDGTARAQPRRPPRQGDAPRGVRRRHQKPAPRSTAPPSPAQPAPRSSTPCW